MVATPGTCDLVSRASLLSLTLEFVITLVLWVEQ